MKRPPLPFIVFIALLFTNQAWVPASPAQESPDTEALIQRVENGLIPYPWIVIKGQEPKRAGLAARMKDYRVPGVGIAVIEGDEIVWAKGYGVKQAGGSDPVDPETLFQAVSISKPVAAAGVLYYVETGLFNLDEDINHWLRSWKVPENQWTRKSKVTLRRLLSHTAGVTVDRFPGYEQGAEVPSLRQILDGAKPANTPAIKVSGEVGAKYSYSGGGYTIVQQLLVDVLNKPFPEIMRRTVLEKVGMKNSTYEQPLPEPLADQAASGHRRDGSVIPGKWHTYPEMAAAGLWTTPSDLGEFAVAIMLAKQGRSETILSRAMTELMLTPVEGEMGLGLRVKGKGPDFHFFHSGENAGFVSLLAAFPERGQGVAVMTNGELGGDLIHEILAGLAVELDWPSWRPAEKGVQAYNAQNLKAVAGTYRFGPKDTIKVSFEQGQLFAEPVYIHPDKSGRCEFYPESETAYFSTETDVSLVFSKNEQGRVTGLTLKRGSTRRKALKLLK